MLEIHWKLSIRHSLGLLVIVLSSCCYPTLSHGQFPDSGTSQAGTLAADGEVRATFRGESELLVQLVVQAASVPGGRFMAGVDYPAPGESLYIHVSGANLLGNTMPRPGERLRVFVTNGENGQWEASNRNWFTTNPRGQIADASKLGNPGPSEREAPVLLGVSTEQVSIGRGNGLKVTLVVPESPAAKAGLEPGDVIVKAQGNAVASGQQLAELYRKARSGFTLTVRNVRNGQEVDIQVETSTGVAATDLTRNRSQDMRRAPLELGLESELAFYGSESALKVTKVPAGSAAFQAGIRPGLLILQANGKKLEKPQELIEAAARSRGRLELRVVDPDSRQEKTIQVTL